MKKYILLLFVCVIAQTPAYSAGAGAVESLAATYAAPIERAMLALQRSYEVTPSETSERGEVKVVAESTTTELHRVCGGVALIVGNQEASMAFGLRDVPELHFSNRTTIESRLVTERTVFPLGCITKSLLTIMISKMVDEKLLHWDLTFGEILGTSLSLPPCLSTLSVRNLVGHTTGFQHFVGNELHTHATDFTLQQVADAFEEESRTNTRFQEFLEGRGTNYGYQNALWALLGPALQIQTKLSMAELYEKYLKGPLALTDMTMGGSIYGALEDRVILTASTSPTPQRGYFPQDSTGESCILRNGFNDMCLNGSTRDMVSVMRSLARAGQTSSSSLTTQDQWAEIHNPRVGPFESPDGYTTTAFTGMQSLGMGRYIYRHRGGSLFYGHMGSMNGVSNVMLYSPEARLGMAVSVRTPGHVKGGFWGDAAYRICDALFETLASTPEVTVPRLLPAPGAAPSVSSVEASSSPSIALLDLAAAVDSPVPVLPSPVTDQVPATALPALQQRERLGIRVCAYLGRQAGIFWGAFYKAYTTPHQHHD